MTDADEAEQLIDKQELADRWDIPPRKISYLRKKDPPLPARQSRPKLLFVPEEADEWARKHAPDYVSVPQDVNALTIDQLADKKNVSKRTIYRWRQRKPPVPCLDERGPRNDLLFDLEEVNEWLGMQGIVPGARGTEGAAASNKNESPPSKEARASGPIEAEDLEDEDGEPGLEHEVIRLRRIAQRQGKLLEHAYENGESEATKQSRLNTHGDVVDLLRKAEKDLQKVKRKKDEVVSRREFEETLDEIAGYFRQVIESLPGEMSASLVQDLQEEGLEIVQDGKFMKILRRELEERAADMLRGVQRRFEEASEA